MAWNDLMWQWELLKQKWNEFKAQKNFMKEVKWVL